MHHWNKKFLPLQHVYHGSLFLQHKFFSCIFFTGSELFRFASWILWESVQFNPAIECSPFLMPNFSKTLASPCSPSLKAMTAEATAVSRTVLATNTLFEQRFQIMLWNNSFGFCVSPWRHFFNNSSFPRSAWENAGFNTFTIADRMVIICTFPS